MKKLTLVFFASLSLLILFTGIANAALCDERADGPTGKIGFVPCGLKTKYTATGVPDGVICPCTLDHFFLMLGDIYTFVVYNIATPLAILMIIIGAGLMMASAGNPNTFNLGKKTVYAAIIGIIFVFGALLIVNTILNILGAPTI